MSSNIIDSETTSASEAAAAPSKRGRKLAEKTKSAKRASQAKKSAVKPKSDRANKKAEVIAMMKRTKGATLPEIMKATGWQAHTVLKTNRGTVRS